MMMMRGLLVVALLFAVANAGNLTLSNVLGSNMVLQRAPATPKLWGWATPGDTVTVLFNSKNYASTAAVTGYWEVTLAATQAGGPYSIAIASSDGAKIALTNILFGEVWICGGQSNMQFTVSQVFNATAEIADSNNYPNIRVMSVGTLHYSSEPLEQLYVPAQLPWSVAGSASVGMGSWTAMSAVCWFTGKNLYNDLKVPVGLISSNWGGTIIQAWSSPVALKVCNVTTSSTGNEANSVLYNAMIVPFQNYVIAGALWYQGEQNAGQAELYSCMFPAMINDWRSLWGAEFPFFFVQLAPFAAGPSSNWPDTRQAQLAALNLSKVAYASAVDLGDPSSPYGNVHPRDKQDVGKRLSVAVRSIAYGEPDLIWEGPTFASLSIKLSGASATITVNWNIPSGGLVFVNNGYPNATYVPANDCANWQVQYSSGAWVPATQGAISGSSVQVTVDNIPSGLTIQAVSYAYASWPITTLFSEQGLPAIPFKHMTN